MYIPKYFNIKNVEEIMDFVQNNAFGTLVTTVKERPIATHIPLQLTKEDDAYYLSGHMAYGNPQWRNFEETKEVLVMFQGPHAYISSSWYEKENVPTWNYQAVHIYGSPNIIEGDALKQDLAQLLQKYESHRDNPILWDTLSPKLLENELKGIIGFKIKVQEVQAAYKLSQNRHEQDYENIIKKLHEENNLNAQQVAQAMERNSNKDA